MVIMSIAIDIISTDEIHLREGTEGRGRTRRRNLITSEAQRAQRFKSLLKFSLCQKGFPL
jgi:hypothetical protein